MAGVTKRKKTRKTSPRTKKASTTRTKSTTSLKRSKRAGSRRATETTSRRGTTRRTRKEKPVVVVGTVETTPVPTEERIRWDSEAPSVGGIASSGPIVVERPEDIPKAIDAENEA